MHLQARAWSVVPPGHTGIVIHRHPLLGLFTGSYLAFVAWVTLTPQSYAAERIAVISRVLAALHRRGYLLSIEDRELEFLANIALFVPVGAFLLLLVGTRLWWVALTASFVLTALIETAQRSIPGRVPDEHDLLANGVGAVVGCLMALVLILPAARRHRKRRAATATRQPSPADQDKQETSAHVASRSSRHDSRDWAYAEESSPATLSS